MSKRFYSKKSEKLTEEVLRAYREGRQKTDVHHARLLEDKLRRDQYDIVSRCALLGYYRHEKGADAPRRWCRHADWIIKTSPDEQFIPFVLHVPQDVSQAQLDDLKEVFLRKVKRNSSNASVAGHAAMFFNQTDEKTASKLFKLAMKLAPDNEWWHRQYVDRHVKKAHSSKQKKHLDSAYKKGLQFVKKFEKTLNLKAPTGMVLRSLFDLALESEDFEMAHRFLKRIKCSKWTKLFPHVKHECAGLLALKEGDVECAKAHLLKLAKKQKGRPKLILAAKLLERHENEVVAQFLDSCLQTMDSDFQADEIKQINGWITRIRAGKPVKLSVLTGSL